MKLKTIKHHQSRRTEKNKRTFGPTQYIQTKHRSLRKRLNFKTFSQVTAVQLFSGSPKITRLLIIFKISKIEHRYFYTSIKVILLRTSAAYRAPFSDHILIRKQAWPVCLSRFFRDCLDVLVSNSCAFPNAAYSITDKKKSN